MLPTLFAQELRATIREYLAATYHFADTNLTKALMARVDEKNLGLFKGPYYDINLPFRPAFKKGEPQNIPLDVKPPFTPFLHQQKSFERLTTQDNQTAKHTLVTTGTGSGKTECFLYPVLDTCLRLQGTEGIKAIILYPMNALATDQAKRIANAIYEDKSTKGQITAGLFIGDDRENPTSQYSRMGKDNVITSREELRKNPPDILLTNYKMLDYLLIRPKDAGIFSNNRRNGLLKYLILDELHTFNGAQGSDVACLIRRLRHRIGTPKGQSGFACVGTSATAESAATVEGNPLLKFASAVFGTAGDDDFDESSIIREDRLTLEEFVASTKEQKHALPKQEEIKHKRDEDATDIITRYDQAFFKNKEPLTALERGEALKSHPLFRTLLSALAQGPMSRQSLCEALQESFPGATSQSEQAQLIDALCALISAARTMDGTRERPFLFVRVHFWMRELKRTLLTVAKEPKFYLDGDEDTETVEPKLLPVAVCRSCGKHAFLTRLAKGDNEFRDDLKQTYTDYFRRAQAVTYFTFDDTLDEDAGFAPFYLEENTLRFTTGPIKKEEAKRFHKIRIWGPRHRKKELKVDQRFCVYCESKQSMAIVGAQGATLGSVAVGALYGSSLAADNEKKLLAFVDSIQDATHRAGFFGGRTFRFTLRGALLREIREAEAQGEEINLNDIASKMLERVEDERGHKNASAAFWPPDLVLHRDFGIYMGSKATGRPSDIDEPFRKRLNLEAHNEFAFNATLGRSLQNVGAAAPYFELELEALAESLLPVLLEEYAPFLAAPQDTEAVKKALKEFVVTALHRLREKGGVEHEWLHSLAKANKEKSRRYLLSKRGNEWMPTGYGFRQPSFIKTAHPAGEFEEGFLTDARPHYLADLLIRAITKKTAPKSLTQTEKIKWNEMLLLIWQALSIVEVLKPLNKKVEDLLALNAKKVLMTAKTLQAKCDHCGFEKVVAKQEEAVFQNSVCWEYRCAGRLQIHPVESVEYYQRQYESKMPTRVFAHEHTGQLQRKERELVEERFKREVGRTANDLNLLTCTPTLEMGIDVGDLSAVMLCAAPPRVASFLQRIGRAGRKTGNAFVLTQAQNRDEQHYWFDDPTLMVKGGVEAPAIYLNAPEMLIRQYAAFCMEQKIQVGLQRIPTKLSELLTGRGTFTKDLYAAVEEDLAKNVQEFLETFFGDAIPEGMREVISEGAKGVKPKLEAALRVVKDQKNAYTKANRSLKKVQSNLSSEGYDDATLQIKKAEVDRQVGSNLRLIHQLENEYVLNFLVEAGILPNYNLFDDTVQLGVSIFGLPESTLTSLVPEPKESKRGKKKSAKGNTDRPNAVSYTWKRGASRAIREFAPGSEYFSHGRRVTINRVQLPTGNLKQWIFCSRCEFHEEFDEKAASKSCPKCKDHDYKMPSQRRVAMRLTQAFASESHQNSLALDISDERNTRSAEMQRFYDFQADAKSNARQSAEGFGIEWCGGVLMREFNIGPLIKQKSQSADDFILFGETVKANGFEICKYCGVHDTGRNRHLARCNQKAVKDDRGRTDHKGKDSPKTFFYRESKSEAVRIQTPHNFTEAAENRHTFEAILYLALRLHFGGAPSHLEVDVMRMYSALIGGHTDLFVLFDLIPGGSGYLRELADNPALLMGMFKKALVHLKACPCEHQRGCHRCLSVKEKMRERTHLSKKTAINMLEDLSKLKDLKETDTLVAPEVKTGDSDLEIAFVQRFRDGMREQGYSETRERVGSYRVFSFKNKTHEVTLRPQVDVGDEQRVAIASRPDYVIELKEPQKDWAVFVDGYEFHSGLSKNKNILKSDGGKRQALMLSQNYRVFAVDDGDINKGVTLSKKLGITDEQWAELISSLAFDGKTWAKASAVQAMTALLSVDEKTLERFEDALIKTRVKTDMRGVNPEKMGEIELWLRGDVRNESMPPGKVGAKLIRENNFRFLALHNGTKSKRARDFSVYLYFDDKGEPEAPSSKKAWSRYYGWMSFLQPKTNLVLVLKKDDEERLSGTEAPEEVAALETDAWQPLLDDEFVRSAQTKALVSALLKHLIAPSRTQVLGDYEVASVWRKEKIALVDFEDKDDIEPEQFTSQGWRLLSSEDDLSEDIIKLLKANDNE